MTEQPQPMPAAGEPMSSAAEDAAGPEPVAAPAVGTADRPEVAVGAAFAGGFLAALILKRLVR